MRNQITASKLTLTALLVGHMIAIGGIPAMVFQSLNVILDQQGLPVGMIAAVYATTTLICGLFFGRVTDQYGPKRILLWFMPLLTVVYLLYPLAHGTGAYIAVRILNGILFSLVLNALVVQLRQRVSKKSDLFQARVHGISTGLNFAGSGVAMYFALKLVSDLLLLWTSVVTLGGIASVLVYWSIFISGTNKRTWRLWIGRVFASVSNFGKGLFVKEAMRAALPDVGVSSAYWAFLVYIALYVGEEAGQILFWSTIANGVAVVAVMPKLVTNRNQLVIGGSIFTLILSFILISSGTYWLLIVAGVLIGIAMAGNNLAILEKVNHVTDQKRLGTGNATALFLRGLGGVIGPSYSGVMWGYFGTKMWLTLIPLLVVSFVLLILLKPKPEPPVVFVNVKDAPCCLWAKVARVTMRGEEELFPEFVDAARSASPVDLQPGKELICKVSHVALAVSMLKTLDEITYSEIGGLFVDRELKILQDELELLLVKRYGGKKYNTEFIVSEYQTSVRSVEEVVRLLRALIILRPNYNWMYSHYWDLHWTPTEDMWKRKLMYPVAA